MFHRSESVNKTPLHKNQKQWTVKATGLSKSLLLLLFIVNIYCYNRQTQLIIIIITIIIIYSSVMTLVTF